MLRSLAVAALVAASASSAIADDGAEPTASTAATATTSRPQLALAVNPPFRWKDGGSIAASLYIGFGQHHAIRANVAQFDYTASVGAMISDLVLGGDSSETRTGRFRDVGASYTYFPNKLWSGLMFEAGLFVRDSDTVSESHMTAERTEVHSTTIAARGHVGWSWLLYNRVFVAAGIGVSRGQEFGTQALQMSLDKMPETRDLSRATLSGEGFVRIGGVFDL